MNNGIVFDAESGEFIEVTLTDEEMGEPPPTPDPIPEPVVVVYQVDLWTRMTNPEAEEVLAQMAEQPVRIRRIFESANSYRSDHELWPLLIQIATALFGEERAAQILAPSQP
ncbi:hypothetical protein EM858_14595 [Agrobacterium sp. CNPSo 2736]|uniref:hypothetical protein n=1 Tax=Agrobacterium sp. CNPSo 2736 TaxID=2499627 RepID=UPI000FD85A21|nr:hypothetical protein [Agrobacterium sp. CNPSo 2736]RVT75672.1 hypothetical protein EM858_14595 [Agrobacterium sp. CNPSo 2736]